MSGEREVLSRLLSGKKNTRLVLRRDAEGLTTGSLVRSSGETWRVQGRISRSGDVVLEPVTARACNPKMTGTPTPQELADRWKEATERAGRNYMAEMTPQEHLDAARNAYVRGHIDHAAFERNAESAIRSGA